MEFSLAVKLIPRKPNLLFSWQDARRLRYFPDQTLFNTRDYASYICITFYLQTTWFLKLIYLLIYSSIYFVSSQLRLSFNWPKLTQNYPPPPFFSHQSPVFGVQQRFSLKFYLAAGRCLEYSANSAVQRRDTRAYTSNTWRSFRNYVLTLNLVSNVSVPESF